MAILTPERQDEPVAGTGADGPAPGHEHPAATAAARVSGATLLLGGVGLLSAVFVLFRLVESWRIGSGAAPHRIELLGQPLSYPVANVNAVVIVLLAALGSVVTGRALGGAVREGWASLRFSRAVSRRQLETIQGALVVRDAHPRAFCAGLLRPRVYVSAAAVALLDQDALNAVLAHERHHALRRDPLRFAAGRVLAHALFFLPELRLLVARHQALAELSADESAVDGAPAQRSALARAMLSFSDASTSGGGGGIDPARIDYLLGEPPSWRFPSLLCVAAAGVLALLVAVAALAGQVASGSATLALPFLSRQPCILVLAMLPAGLGLLAAGVGRRLRVRSPQASEVLD
jgi:Zn-dependent protease with chaperone function